MRLSEKQMSDRNFFIFSRVAENKLKEAMASMQLKLDDQADYVAASRIVDDMTALMLRVQKRTFA